MRIAVVANTSWYLYNFRRNLMRALREAGHEVLAVGPADVYAPRLAEDGFAHAVVPFTGRGINPLRESITVVGLARMLRRHRIELALSFTPKGNIYTMLAARALGVMVLPNVSGLGRTFIRRSPLTAIARGLYRSTLPSAPAVFFQNEEDRAAFVHDGLVDAERAIRVPGSGVDLERFRPPRIDSTADDRFVFLLVARLLWDKGVGEFVAAARTLAPAFPQARFRMLGFASVDNPSAVPLEQLDAWAREGVVELLPATDDVRPYLAQSDCVVLPSYREGVPRSLLEAAAMARPVITTDAPGCRDTVTDGVTGFLCRLRDADDLADKMQRMLCLTPQARQRMGVLARAKMEREFDERRVIDIYLQTIERVSEKGRTAAG